MTRPTPPGGYVWTALKADETAHLLTQGGLLTAWQTAPCGMTPPGNIPLTRAAAGKKPGCPACLAAVAAWRPW